MASLNKVQLIGNVGADPEIRSAGQGQVANLRVATSETWKDREGQRQEKTEWHTVTIWNDRLVDFVEKYVTKGSQIYAEGKLQTRKWTDKDGNDRFSTEIVIERFSGEIKLLGRRDENQSGGRDREMGRRDEDRPQRSDDRRDDRGGGAQGNGGSGGGRNYDDDDIPF